MLAIFEVDAIDVERFYVNALKLTFEDVGLVILESKFELTKFRKRYPCNIVPSIALEDFLFTPENISQFFLSYDITHVLLSSHQIPYQLIVLIASRSAVKTIYIQHGLYIEFMRREFLFYLYKFAKAFRYLLYLVYISMNLKNIKVFMQVAGSQVFGSRRIPYIDQPLLFPSHSLVFSRYWGDWHEEHYLFTQENMHIIGSHDLRMHTLDQSCTDSTVIYCYQTLVEDGRISLDKIDVFYIMLAQYASDYGLRVVVKSHPRANPELINRLSTNYGFLINNESTPNGSIVIGHYSSLLAFWGFCGKKVLAVALPGHPIPESIAKWCDTSYMHIPHPVEIKPPNIDALIYYFGPSFSTQNVLDVISNIVTEDAMSC